MAVFTFRVKNEIQDRAVIAVNYGLAKMHIAQITKLDEKDYYGLRQANENEIAELKNSGSFIN